MEEQVLYCVHCNNIAKWMFYRELDILTADSDQPVFEEHGEPVCTECKKNLERIFNEAE